MKAVAIGCYFERPNKVQRSLFDFPPSACLERERLIFKKRHQFESLGNHVTIRPPGN